MTIARKKNAAAIRPSANQPGPAASGHRIASGTDSDNAEEMPPDHVGYAELTGQGDDPAVQGLVGKALVRRIVKDQLIDHVGSAIGNGSLAATKHDGRFPAFFSNWGPWVDCCAIGADVRSTYIRWTGRVEDEDAIIHLLDH